MLKYKINIADALERKGFNTYKAKISKLLSQDTLKKIKHEDTNISLESINRICMILDMQPKDLIEYVENEEEKKKYNFWNYFENISLQSDKSMILYNCQEENQMTITRKGERRANGSHERERNQNCEKLNYLRNSPVEKKRITRKRKSLKCSTKSHWRKSKSNKEIWKGRQTHRPPDSKRL